MAVLLRGCRLRRAGVRARPRCGVRPRGRPPRRSAGVSSSSRPRRRGRGRSSPRPTTRNASVLLWAPLSSIAWTPSHAAKATGPSTWCRCFPTSATAALRPIIAMMPLSLYRNGRVGFPCQLTQDVVPDPAAGLLGDRAELRQPPRVLLRRDVRHVADGVHARVPVHREVGPYVDPATASGRQPGAGRDRGGRLAAAPDHGPGADDRPVVELDPVGMHGGDTGAQPDLGALPW